MNSNAFTVYRTSAGAGKTYTISKEFIRLCLSDNTSPQEIAAITFTNKAANEMKERILEYLYNLSLANPKNAFYSELLKKLTTETGYSEENVKEKTKKTLTNILHNYHRFSVSTIDSFIHDLLRMFSRDLKLPDNFNVETDTDVLTEMLVDTLFTKLGIQSEPEKTITEYVIRYTLNEIEGSNNWDITGILRKNAKMLFSEDSTYNIPELQPEEILRINECSNTIKHILKAHETLVRATAVSAFDFIQKCGYEASDFYQGARGIYGFFAKLQTYRAGYEIVINSYVRATVDENKWAKASSKIDKDDQLKQLLIEKYNCIAQNSVSQYIHLILAIRNALPGVALLSYFNMLLKDYYEINNVIHISEFNKYISSVIRNEPAPFIYERLGQRFRHFLFDEFQDTSIMQWHNFLPLLDNASSESNSTNLVVGDVKQSIYRFRNSEMQQLLELPAIYKKEISGNHFSIIEQNLAERYVDKRTQKDFSNVNYRSGEHIVRFNNFHFSWIREKYQLAENNPFINEAYQDTIQSVSDKKVAKGYVQIRLIEETNYFNETLQSVEEIIRNVETFSEIAILARNNDKGKAIAQYLMQLSSPIPVISNESLELSFSPKVNFIIDFVQLIANNNDSLALAKIVTFLQLYKKNDFPTLIAEEWLENNITAFTQPLKSLQNLFDSSTLKLDIETISSISLQPLITSLIVSLSFDNPVDPYILFFRNCVFDFCRTNNGNMYDFLQWWEQKGKRSSIVISEGTNAVRIISVHKAKGLEFPVVIYPFADYKLFNPTQKMWVPISQIPDKLSEIKLPEKIHSIYLPVSINSKLPECPLKTLLENEKQKQELDSLNIHYVAMTRASEKLFVLSKYIEPENDDFKSIAHIMNRFVESAITSNDFFKVSEENPMIFNYGIESNHTNSDTKQQTQDQSVLNEFQVNNLTQTQPKIKLTVYTENTIKKNDLGIVFHKFIATVNNLKNLKKQFEFFCHKVAVPEKYQEKVLQFISQIEHHEKLIKIFNSNLICFSERDIITPNLTVRPDKIFIGETSVFLLDFKTGKIMLKHKEQIRSYSEIINKIFSLPVEMFLVYLHEDSVDIEELT